MCTKSVKIVCNCTELLSPSSDNLLCTRVIYVATRCGRTSERFGTRDFVLPLLDCGWLFAIWAQGGSLGPNNTFWWHHFHEYWSSGGMWITNCPCGPRPMGPMWSMGSTESVGPMGGMWPVPQGPMGPIGPMRPASVYEYVSVSFACLWNFPFLGSHRTWLALHTHAFAWPYDVFKLK